MVFSFESVQKWDRDVFFQCSPAACGYLPASRPERLPGKSGSHAWLLFAAKYRLDVSSEK